MNNPSYWWVVGTGQVGHSRIYGEELEPKKPRKRGIRGAPMLMNINLIYQDPNWNVSKPHDTSARRASGR